MKKTTNQVLIDKLVLEMNYDFHPNPHELHIHIEEWVKNKLLPWFENYLDDLDYLSEQLIRIDRIPIEINIDDVSDLNIQNIQNIQHDIIRQIEEKLEIELHTEELTTIIQSPKNSHSGKENDPNDSSIPNTEFLGLLRHFLETGNLPWWSKIEDRPHFKSDFKTWINELNEEAFFSFLQEIIEAKNGTVFMRFISLFTLRELKGIIINKSILSNKNISDFSFFFQELEKVPSLFASPKSILAIQKIILLQSIQFDSIVWTKKSELFNILTRTLSIDNGTLLPSTIAQKVGYYHKKGFQRLYEFAETSQYISISELIRNSIKEEVLNLEKKYNLSIDKDSPADKNEFASDSKKKNTHIDKNASSKGIPGLEKNKDQNTDFKKEINSLESSKGKQKEYVVENAGLVLLSPFLKHFISNLGLKVNPEDISKSIFALNYIATGKTNFNEFDFPLCKLLMGIHPEEWIEEWDDDLFIEKLEKETPILLETVIGHWEKLGESDANHFRESFLARKGKLYTNDDAWNLKVEETGYDILLRFIPWGFQTIRIPNENKLLLVDWFN